jgi:predicted phosphodiesterase
MFDHSALPVVCSGYVSNMKRRSFLKITLPLALAGKAAAAPAAVPDLCFGVIADPQYADAAPKWGRFYRNSLAKLEHAVADLNKHPLDFTATLGDLIDRDFVSFSSVMPIYAKLTASHFPVCGNHDFEVADEEKSKVLGAIGLEKAYYSVVRKSWRFLFLDGTDIAIWRYPADDGRTAAAKEILRAGMELKVPNFQEYNAAIGSEQMEWIAAELEAAKAAGERVILFCHYPAFPVGNAHNLWNDAKLVELIARHTHAVAYMNGHNHAGNYGKSGSCHFVNFKGMVETEADTAYSVVKCFPDRIEIEGYGMEPDRKLD